MIPVRFTCPRISKELPVPICWISSQFNVPVRSNVPSEISNAPVPVTGALLSEPTVVIVPIEKTPVISPMNPEAVPEVTWKLFKLGVILNVPSPGKLIKLLGVLE